MIFTIKQLQHFLDRKFELIPKSLGVELVELGFANYQKLTSENYDFWWYEVSDKSKIDKNAFTYNWDDIIPTKKIEMVKRFIPFHKGNGSMYPLISAILNIESARFDGFDIITGMSEFERQIEFYYSKRKKPIIQMQLEFNCT